uniref:Dihydrouridine synthase 4-like (S. cerevisiae) n=1 Tax=Salmo trutta TaxID=8032 RepID=A0A673VL68_SALTR
LHSNNNAFQNIGTCVCSHWMCEDCQFADHPLIVQFAASDAQTLADAACVVEPFSDGVDLNCGCPQRWAMSEGYGAFLINKPELVKDMFLFQLLFPLSFPRIHKDLGCTVDLCQKAEAAGVSWITVHGRSANSRSTLTLSRPSRSVCQSLSSPAET